MGFPWSFFFLIAASVTEMMQVAMNEWGHSLWITEEFFAAPFHWPFVAYGWLASGIFALWAESALRLLGIEKEAEDAEQRSPDRRKATVSARGSRWQQSMSAAEADARSCGAAAQAVPWLDYKFDIVFWITAAFVVGAAGGHHQAPVCG